MVLSMLVGFMTVFCPGSLCESFPAWQSPEKQMVFLADNLVALAFKIKSPFNYQSARPNYLPSYHFPPPSRLQICIRMCTWCLDHQTMAFLHFAFASSFSWRQSSTLFTGQPRFSWQTGKCHRMLMGPRTWPLTGLPASVKPEHWLMPALSEWLR